MSEIFVILAVRPQAGLTRRRLGWREASAGLWRVYWREAANSPHLGGFAPGLLFRPSPALLEDLAALEAKSESAFAVLTLRGGESPEAAALRAPSLPRAASWSEILSPERAYPPPAY